MPEPASRRVNLASARIEAGFRTHAAFETREPAAELAGQLSQVYDTAIDFQLEEGDTISAVQYQIDTSTLRRLRKISEVVEDSLDVNLGHSKFARLASTASNLNSMMALSVAGWNLLKSAQSLDQAVAKADSIRNVARDSFDTFYRSLGIFFIECFLFTTPFSYKIAWRGTRYLNNRFLYRLMDSYSILYRLILSEIHYAIRGFTNLALRHVDQFTSYLTTMTVQTIELLVDHPDVAIDDIVSKIEEVVMGFKTFVEDHYEISTPDIDLQKIVEDVIAELSGFLDLSAFSIELDIDGITW